MIKRTLWLIIMACLGISLYTIVMERSHQIEDQVILGGYAEVYAGNDHVSYANPNAEPEVVDDGLNWPDIDITFNRTIDAGMGILNGMLQDMEAAGFTPYIASSYRTYSYQAQLFNTKAFGLFMAMGYTNKDYDEYGTEEGSEVYNAYQIAAEQAKKITAPPGSSEHQLGLAVDIWDKERDRLGSYTYMDEAFRTWLEDHSCEYGFIQRYPTRKLLRTGWDEPWHYRYVGVEVATFIKNTGMCYEEFYKHYVPDYKE